MGSWSETCFATNLPIHEGGCRIVAIPVVPVEGMSSQRVVRPNFVPAGPPVRGVYDTYGGIELDDGELEILEPLIEEIKAVNATMTYPEKDTFRGSLRGIGVAKFNEELHLGEPLPPEEIGTYEGAKTTRDYVLLGDSAWLEFPVAAFPEDDPTGSTKKYPVQWCFMLEEVYDHFLSYEFGKGFYRHDADSIRASVYEAFEIFGKLPDYDEIQVVRARTKEEVEALSSEDQKAHVELILNYSELKLHQNFFSRWAEDTCYVSSFDKTAIYPFLKGGVSQEIQDRFYDLMHLMHELDQHRIVLNHSTGPQFGQYTRHQKLHTLCGKIVRAYKKDYKARNGETYKDSDW